MTDQNIFETEIQDYLILKSESTKTVYSASFNEFLRYYENKHGEGKGFTHFLDRTFEELRKDCRDQKRLAEIGLVQYVDWLKNKGK